MVVMIKMRENKQFCTPLNREIVIFLQTQRDFYTIFCMNLHVLAKWDLFIKDLRHFNQNSLCTQLKTAILVACELQRPQLDL